MNKTKLIVEAIAFSILFLLIATGFQCLFMLKSPDFAGYNVINWIFQGMFWILCICLGIILAIHNYEENINKQNKA